MSMFGNISIQAEMEDLLLIIERARKDGISDGYILKEIEEHMKEIIKECKGGWR